MTSNTICHAEVAIDGELDACNRPAVGTRQDEEGPWPACESHMPPAVYLGHGVWGSEHEDLTSK